MSDDLLTVTKSTSSGPPSLLPGGYFWTQARLFIATNAINSDIATSTDLSVTDQLSLTSMSATAAVTGNLDDGGRLKDWPLWRQPIHGVILLAVAYIVVAVVGVVNNGLLIAVIYSRPTMHTVTNYFLVNLATADILVCVFVLPITLLQNIFYEWWYGPVVCRLAPYLQGVSVGASVNTLASVSVERFLAVSYPRTSKMTVRQAAVVMVMTWFIPIGLFVPWLLVYRQQSFVLKSMKPLTTCLPAWQSQTVNQVYTVCVVFMTCYIIPLACIAIFYVLIGWRVSRRKIVDQMCTRSAAAASIRRSKSRVLQMLVVVVVLFAVSWLPLYVANLRYLFASRSMGQLERTFLRTYLLPVTQWMGAANSCVNPFIYCYFNCTFRSAIGQLLRNCLGGGRVWRFFGICRQGASRVGSESGGGRTLSQAIVMTTAVSNRRE